MKVEDGRAGRGMLSGDGSDALGADAAHHPHRVRSPRCVVSRRSWPYPIQRRFFMNKDKGVLDQKKPQTYKSTFTDKNERILREETLKATPDEEKLSDDAYKHAFKSALAKEYIYPYIPISTIWISPIEDRYVNLSAEEIMHFYLKDFVDPYFHPKDFQYYQAILFYTGSVQFDSTIRTGGEWAFSKAFIKRILLPEQWDEDLYKAKEMISSKRDPRNKYFFNYFDYIKAWEIAFCYDNRQRKHSWFIQIKIENGIKFPQWFQKWFSEWGFNPIILPKKIKGVYDDFESANPSLKNSSLYFCVLYQIPWILKWDVIVSPRSVEKFGVSTKIPYLGRRLMIKWWDKFEFFKDSIFSNQGLISLEPI